LLRSMKIVTCMSLSKSETHLSLSQLTDHSSSTQSHLRFLLSIHCAAALCTLLACPNRHTRTIALQCCALFARRPVALLRRRLRPAGTLHFGVRVGENTCRNQLGHFRCCNNQEGRPCATCRRREPSWNAIPKEIPWCARITSSSLI
jgi:hypothetical protein